MWRFLLHTSIVTSWSRSVGLLLLYFYKVMRIHKTSKEGLCGPETLNWWKLPSACLSELPIQKSLSSNCFSPLRNRQHFRYNPCTLLQQKKIDKLAEVIIVDFKSLPHGLTPRSFVACSMRIVFIDDWQLGLIAGRLKFNWANSD